MDPIEARRNNYLYGDGNFAAEQFTDARVGAWGLRFSPVSNFCMTFKVMANDANGNPEPTVIHTRLTEAKSAGKAKELAENFFCKQYKLRLDDYYGPLEIEAQELHSKLDQMLGLDEQHRWMLVPSTKKVIKLMVKQREALVFDSLEHPCHSTAIVEKLVHLGERLGFSDDKKEEEKERDARVEVRQKLAELCQIFQSIEKRAIKKPTEFFSAGGVFLPEELWNEIQIKMVNGLNQHTWNVLSSFYRYGERESLYSIVAAVASRYLLPVEEMVPLNDNKKLSICRKLTRYSTLPLEGQLRDTEVPLLLQNCNALVELHTQSFSILKKVPNPLQLHSLTFQFIKPHLKRQPIDLSKFEKLEVLTLSFPPDTDRLEGYLAHFELPSVHKITFANGVRCSAIDEKLIAVLKERFPHLEELAISPAVKLSKESARQLKAEGIEVTAME
jgi:hypothetical protein